MSTSKAALQKYEMEMLSELEGLIADVTKTGRGELLPLDRSYASLDRVEDYYALVLDKKVKVDAKRAEQRVARYAGAVVVEQAGGKWAAGPDDGVDPFVVTKLRAAPKAVYGPLHRVSEIENYRFPGVLRDRTERFDLELQRRQIAELTGDLRGTLTRLRADAKEQTRTDPGALESTADLTKYEAALAAVKAPNASRDLRRRIRTGAAIAIGNLMQQELGAASWSVEEDPKNIDFGAWTLFGVRLSNTVERVDPRTKPDGLRSSIEKMIANRKKKG
jgi:hypothetical protein